MVDPVRDDRDREEDPSDRYEDYYVCDPEPDPDPYTVAGASVVVVPGPDEAKVDPDPTAVNPAAIDPVASLLVVVDPVVDPVAYEFYSFDSVVYAASIAVPDSPVDPAPEQAEAVAGEEIA